MSSRKVPVVTNQIYHIFNRGEDKAKIFFHKEDYERFLAAAIHYRTKTSKFSYEQLLGIGTNDPGSLRSLRTLKLGSSERPFVQILAYCLMPNHFHMLIKQSSSDSIDNFINSLNTRYVMYFNRKYKRIGPLFQGVYKAVLIETDEQLSYLSAYIHRNPNKLLRISERGNIDSLLSQPTSLSDYIGRTNTAWINTKVILTSFSKSNPKMSYARFVLGYSQLKANIANFVID